MSRAKAFLFAGAEPGGHVPTVAPRLRVTAGKRDAEAMLYEELLAALGRRGLTRLTHPCPHCGEPAIADLGKYPEIKMACRDAVTAWWKAIEAEADAQKAATAEANR